MLAVAFYVLVWLGWLAIWVVAKTQLNRTRWRIQPALGESYRWLQIAGGLLILGSMLFILPDIHLWSSEAFAFLLLIALVAGLAFSAWGEIHLGMMASNGATTDAEPQLIRSGPYGIVRNPICGGLVLAIGASTVATGHVLAMIGAALFAAGVVRMVRRQEDELADRFDAGAYAAYRDEVPMFVPVWLTPPDWLVARVRELGALRTLRRLVDQTLRRKSPDSTP